MIQPILTKLSANTATNYLKLTKVSNVISLVIPQKPTDVIDFKRFLNGKKRKTYYTTEK